MLVKAAIGIDALSTKAFKDCVCSKGVSKAGEFSNSMMKIKSNLRKI